MNKSGFIRKKVKTLTLGERLSGMREERHMSIADVSRNTGIQVAYLEYLEQGVFEKLPAEVYVRGFLRRYAEYLGISEEPILRQYDRERGMNRSLNQDEKKEQNSFIQGAFQKIPSAIVTPRRITVTLSLCMVLTGLFYVYSEYQSFISEPILIISEPSKEVTQTNDSFLMVSGKTDPDSRVFINDQKVLVDEDGGFQEKIELQNDVNTVIIRSVNRFNKEARKVYSIDAELEEKKLEEDIVEKSMGKTIMFRTGKETMWVLIVVDGEQKVSAVAPPESRWEFVSQREAVISVGNGRNMYVTIGTQGVEKILSEKVGIAEEYRLDMEKEVFVSAK